MGSIYKTIPKEDRVNNQSLLHEAIPITGTVVSGTYGGDNIKNYSHGQFQSVYDYPHLSSSANHIFDITMGFSSDSPLSGSKNVEQQEEKIQIYNQMAQQLAGHDEEGNILKLDKDGNITSGGEKMKEVFFIAFSRLLTKDEIKKESFSLDFWRDGGVSGSGNSRTNLTEFHDRSGSYKVNSPMGEYDVLTSGSTGDKHGHIYYQPGIAVISSSVFEVADEFGSPGGTTYVSSTGEPAVDQSMVSSSISGNADALRYRMHDIDFNNTTEMNNTIYFCRIKSNDFNYSSNPTYTSSSKIQVKNKKSDSPAAYATTIGLHSADNALLASAKVSEPIKISPQGSTVLRVRLDW